MKELSTFLVEDSMDEFMDLPIKSPTKVVIPVHVNSSEKSSQNKIEIDATASYLSQCLVSSKINSVIHSIDEAEEEKITSSFELEVNRMNTVGFGAKISEPVHAFQSTELSIYNPFLDEEVPLVMDSYSDMGTKEDSEGSGRDILKNVDEFSIPDLENLGSFGSDPSLDLLNDEGFECFDDIDYKDIETPLLRRDKHSTPYHVTVPALNFGTEEDNVYKVDRRNSYSSENNLIHINSSPIKACGKPKIHDDLDNLFKDEVASYKDFEEKENYPKYELPNTQEPFRNYPSPYLGKKAKSQKNCISERCKDEDGIYRSKCDLAYFSSDEAFSDIEGFISLTLVNSDSRFQIMAQYVNGMFNKDCPQSTKRIQQRTQISTDYTSKYQKQLQNSTCSKSQSSTYAKQQNSAYSKNFQNVTSLYNGRWTSEYIEDEADAAFIVDDEEDEEDLDDDEEIEDEDGTFIKKKYQKPKNNSYNKRKYKPFKKKFTSAYNKRK